MAEFYFPRTTERAEQIFANQPDLLEHYRQYSNRTDNTLLPHQPYLMSCEPGDRQTLQALERFSSPELQRLQQVAQEYDELTVALAYVSEELIKPVMQLLDKHGTTATGAIVGAANSKYKVFQRAIVRYQQALLDLHEASQAKAQATGARTKGAHNAVIAAKESHARRMHAEMNLQFKTQLQRYAANLGASAKRSVLLNAERGINVARSGRSNKRNGQTLRLANSQQVATVKRFVNDSQMLGRGVLFLDVGLRGIKAYNADNSGREGVSQVFGFGSSAGTGALVAWGTRSIGMALMLTPIGWKILIGAAIVGGFMAASYADENFQELGGRLYDRLRVRL
ncbi:hypothetical protein MN202_14135 [Rheinheimera muenzenbergensis]|uniref:Uncharacterized protein n=1 Tax=Rheinheimera muenzenbergensis TaxID=1193628 RepID=A0ABU8C8T3_9GAMM